jgi:hypothetical protein
LFGFFNGYNFNEKSIIFFNFLKPSILFLDLDGMVGGIELSLIMPITALHILKIHVNVLDSNAIGVICRKNKEGCS